MGEDKIGDLPIYYTGTPGGKGVLVLPDIFGWSQNKGRFYGIADTLAEAGYFVLLTDPFKGDTASGKPDVMAWIKSFPYDTKIGADLEASFQWLKDKGSSDIGVVGFCWGCWAMCK